ncbi:hypothetical protein RvY_00851 [Ramazzottius varieornatus]|uniref:Uncharacterized protein n=1 Tax=Ramazzottius varieornatus TaxID=947166 RepID=A0A1D1UP07_RAMVA|nr:hypothetical protein RvY_00851 [Ramazzottius varieornatus]
MLNRSWVLAYLPKSCNTLIIMSFNICSTPVIMLALMVPGLIILLVDHHNRVEEEAFFAEMKRNPNKTLSSGPQGVGLMDLLKHEHHKEHDHDETVPSNKAKTS